MVLLLPTSHRDTEFRAWNVAHGTISPSQESREREEAEGRKWEDVCSLSLRRRSVTVQTDGSHFKVRSSSTFEKSIARLRAPGSPTGTCDGRLKQPSTSYSLPTQTESLRRQEASSWCRGRCVGAAQVWCHSGLKGSQLFSLCRFHFLLAAVQKQEWTDEHYRIPKRTQHGSLGYTKRQFVPQVPSGIKMEEITPPSRLTSGFNLWKVTSVRLTEVRGARNTRALLWYHYSLARF